MVIESCNYGNSRKCCKTAELFHLQDKGTRIFLQQLPSITGRGLLPGVVMSNSWHFLTNQHVGRGAGEAITYGEKDTGR